MSMFPIIKQILNFIPLNLTPVQLSFMACPINLEVRRTIQTEFRIHENNISSYYSMYVEGGQAASLHLLQLNMVYCSLTSFTAASLTLKGWEYFTN